MPRDDAAALPESERPIRTQTPSTPMLPTAPEKTLQQPLTAMLQTATEDTVELAPLPSLDVQALLVAGGEAVGATTKSPLRTGPNQDAVAAHVVDDESGILIVADGVGGHRGGHKASHLLVESLKKSLRQALSTRDGQSLRISGVLEIPAASTPRAEFRTHLLAAIEMVNRRLLRGRVGAATTLALVEVQNSRIRTYHIGDSEILVVSQRGRIKYSTVSHSPVGYAFESGLLTEEEALFHPDRHLVSNVVGSHLMSIELGPWLTLAPRDTVLLASDGLFDNLKQSEIIEIIRSGPLEQSVRQLAEDAWLRMLQADADQPSKPDDLTILAYRNSRSRSTQV